MGSRAVFVKALVRRHTVASRMNEHLLIPFLTEEDGDAAGFMVQCERCMAWQHGPCMGFASESDIPDGDYYCERCKPEDHADLLK